MAQILTDIYEGYIMYSEMMEYKSIRNFRFKKLKKYKIAKMKHQLHTLKDIGNYKPNLVVRVLTHLWKTQKCLWGSVVGMFKVGSSTNQLRGYTRQSFDKPTPLVRTPEVIFKEWLAIKTGGLSMVGITLNYTEQFGGAKTFKVSKRMNVQWGTMTDEVNDIQKVDKYLNNLVKDLEDNITNSKPKQPTHAKYLGDRNMFGNTVFGHSDFTVGKVYNIEEYTFHEHFGSEYIRLCGDKKNTKWIFRTKGDNVSRDKFELIYDDTPITVEDYKEIYEVYRQTGVVPSKFKVVNFDDSGGYYETWH